MRAMLPFVLVILLSFSVQSYPTGVDDRGDDGCLCHGGSDETTVVKLTGLPEKYNASQSYNITIDIVSPVQESENQEDAKGGFRLLISGGSILADGWQNLDDGYTHTSEINKQRTWNATWIAPSDDSKYVTFVLHGNAVNGNNESSGDEWNSESLAVPGVNFTGEVILEDVSHEVSNLFVALSVTALVTLCVLVFYVVRD